MQKQSQPREVFQNEINNEKRASCLGTPGKRSRKNRKWIYQSLQNIIAFVTAIHFVRGIVKIQTSTKLILKAEKY